MASGKVMFHGPAQEALEYFKSAGMAGFAVRAPSFMRYVERTGFLRNATGPSYRLTVYGFLYFKYLCFI